MKPFNLQEALSGDIVTTRDGRRVTCIRRSAESDFQEYPKYPFGLTGYIHNNGQHDQYPFTMKGGANRFGIETEADLFMANEI